MVIDGRESNRERGKVVAVEGIECYSMLRAKVLLSVWARFLSFFFGIAFCERNDQEELPNHGFFYYLPTAWW